MEPRAFAQALRTEAAALAVAADLAPSDRPVPACPGIDEVLRRWGRVGEAQLSVEGDVGVVRVLRAAVAGATVRSTAEVRSGDG